MDDLSKRLIRISDRTNEIFPFDECTSILERSLWVLWEVKEKLNTKRLNSEQISDILRELKEISIPASSIKQSLKRAGDKIHCYYENDQLLYEIMKPGKEYLTSISQQDSVEVFYFEPGKKYTSKKLLKDEILKTFKGELKIVDPYCGERTLDIISGIMDRPVKFLTKIDNIQDKKVQEKFLRELRDYKAENANFELKDYPNRDLHDRYIICPSDLAILGHSIKDVGGKESFAIIFNKDKYLNIFEALNENFDTRWKQSRIL
jgi:hypothetical protein